MSRMVVVPPGLPVTAPRSFVSITSIVVERSAISFSISRMSEEVPLVEPSFHMGPWVLRFAFSNDPKRYE